MKPDTKKHPHAPAFGEIITSNLTSYMAQCWDWETLPSFGSLVCTEHNELLIYGIVTALETGSTDPNRLPFPYQKTHAELRREHPQIFEFLKTVFTASIVGHSTAPSVLHRTLPPHPAQIHQFVRPATPQEEQLFFSSPHFLALFFNTNAGNPLLDELLITLLSTLITHDMLTPALFEDYYHTLTLLLGNDYRRLKVLLQRIETAHASVLAKQLTLS
jgi:hypothetical protein